MTHAPRRIWATTAREGFDTIHSEDPPNEWPQDDHPYDYPPAEYALQSDVDALIKALEDMLELQDLMMRDVDHGKSFYQNDTLVAMNEYPGRARRAIAMVQS